MDIKSVVFAAGDVEPVMASDDLMLANIKSASAQRLLFTGKGEICLPHPRYLQQTQHARPALV